VAAHEDPACFARTLLDAVSAGHRGGGRIVPGARDVIDAAALGQAVITAHSRADLARLAELAGRTDLLDAPSSPVLTLVRHRRRGARRGPRGPVSQLAGRHGWR
jgi:hypothetical protein